MVIIVYTSSKLKYFVDVSQVNFSITITAMRWLRKELIMQGTNHHPLTKDFIITRIFY